MQNHENTSVGDDHVASDALQDSIQGDNHKNTSNDTFIYEVIEVNSPTQLLNCQWNSSGIDDCQVLKYQSSQSYKVKHL